MANVTDARNLTRMRHPNPNRDHHHPRQERPPNLTFAIGQVMQALSHKLDEAAGSLCGLFRKERIKNMVLICCNQLLEVASKIAELVLEGICKTVDFITCGETTFYKYRSAVAIMEDDLNLLIGSKERRVINEFLSDPFRVQQKIDQLFEKRSASADPEEIVDCKNKLRALTQLHHDFQFFQKHYREVPHPDPSTASFSNYYHIKERHTRNMYDLDISSIMVRTPPAKLIRHEAMAVSLHGIISWDSYMAVFAKEHARLILSILKTKKLEY